MYKNQGEKTVLPNYYRIPIQYQSISIEDLSEQNPECQKDIMREWFFENYQDPVHECPYDGKEGGYQYIHGGPYLAADLLYAEFNSAVDEKVILALAEELDGLCHEWSGMSQPDIEDFYMLDVISPNVKPAESLKLSIEDLKEMLTVTLDDKHQQKLYQMVYVNLITVLETYLAEFFITKIEHDELYMRRFVESNPSFKNEKISLADIYKKQETLTINVKKHLLGLIWHNLPKLNEMFKSTFDIDFTDKIQDLVKRIDVRHDLVHRNAKTKDGLLVEVLEPDIEGLIREIENLSKHIENAKLVSIEAF